MLAVGTITAATVAKVAGAGLVLAAGAAGVMYGAVKCGERLIKGVNKTWQYVKPKVAQSANKLKDRLVKMGQEVLLNFIERVKDEAKVRPELYEHMQGALDNVKNFLTNGKRLETTTDLENAIQAQQQLQTAIEYYKLQEDGALLMTKTLHLFLIISTEIEQQIDKGCKNMEDYLRLQAAQQLLKDFEERIRSKGQDITCEDISDNDYFILDFAQAVTKKQMITEDNLLKFTNLYKEKYGKSFETVIYGKMQQQWEYDLKVENEKYLSLTKEQAELKANYQLTSELNTDRPDLGITKISEEEFKSKYNSYQKDIDTAYRNIQLREKYIQAFEGTLCVLEGNDKLRDVIVDNFNNVVSLKEEQLYDMLETLKQQAKELSGLLIECLGVENGTPRPWNTLNSEDQENIKLFADIFIISSKKRAEELADDTLEKIEAEITC